MVVAAAVAALVVLGLLAEAVVALARPAPSEDEPRSTPLAGGVSVPVAVASIIPGAGSVIVVLAPPWARGRPLGDLADRDWGAVTLRSPPNAVLQLLEHWERSGEALVLQRFADRNLVALSDPESAQPPLVMSAA